MQSMQFKAYTEAFTSKGVKSSTEKSARGGEPHHGQHGNRQMQVERGHGPGRGGHYDARNNHQSNARNNGGSAMDMSAPPAEMSTYHYRKRPDMHVFVANPATMVGQQPQMMYPPQVGRRAPQILRSQVSTRRPQASNGCKQVCKFFRINVMRSADQQNRITLISEFFRINVMRSADF